jgi:hypothetical protein
MKDGRLREVSEAHRPWWEEIHLCKGITKKGKRCKKPTRKPYEKEPGNLVIPLTCSLHADQEEEIRKKLESKRNE